MSTCKICQFEIIEDSVSVCPNCGAEINTDQGSRQTTDSESKKAVPPTDNGETIPDSDNLEICDTGELLNPKSDHSDAMEETGPIGQVSIPLQLNDEEQDDDVTDSQSREKHGSIQKLSEEQVRNIRSNLLNEDNQKYVSPGDASSIISDLSKEERENTRNKEGSESSPESAAGPPIPQTKQTPQEDTMPADKSLLSSGPTTGSQTTTVRRMAYFHKNFVQLTGPIRPSSGEEMIINDRHYLLKPKRIKQEHAIAAFSVLIVILLLIVGNQFVSPTLPGSGGIIGVVLDKDGKPIISGVEVALPEAGRKVISDAVGFFRFDKVPTGVYVIRLTLPGGKTATENVSVVSDQITLLSIDTDKAVSRKSVSTASVAGGPASPPYPETQVSRRPSHGSESSNAETPAKPKKEYSALKLKANVDQAKLTVNGQVLGNGNLTYRKLRPGKHDVVVSCDGYAAWNGSVRLKANETYTLSVTLDKLTAEAKETTYSAEDFYHSGKTMLSEGNTAAAIDDFTEAINLQPSMADAYAARAGAYRILENNSAAEKDYIRAGELYVNNKRYETASSMFTKAIDINKKSIAALLNRGDLYRRQNNRSDALNDYKAVVKYDKDNFRGNFGLGKVYFAMGKHKDADKKLRKARDIDSRVPEVYHYLMLNYLARDDFNKVKKTYSDFKDNVSDDDIQAFKDNQRFDALHRIVGEYVRP